MDPVQNPPRERRRRGAVVLLGIAAFGLAAASAASLGGLTTSSLGADNDVVTSCETDGVTIDYGTPAYDATSGLYKVSTVTVGGIDAGCSGKTVAVTLSDAANASLGSGSTAIAGTTATITLSAPTNAKLVVGAAAVIS